MTHLIILTGAPRSNTLTWDGVEPPSPTIRSFQFGGADKPVSSSALDHPRWRQVRDPDEDQRLEVSFIADSMHGGIDNDFFRQSFAAHDDEKSQLVSLEDVRYDDSFTTTNTTQSSNNSSSPPDPTPTPAPRRFRPLTPERPAPVPIPNPYSNVRITDLASIPPAHFLDSPRPGATQADPGHQRHLCNPRHLWSSHHHLWKESATTL